MKKRNRILAMLLTAILTLSMLPSEAFATEAIDTGETAVAAVEEVVSSVGEEQDVEATTEYEAQEVEEAEEAVAEETVAEEAVAEEAVEDQEAEEAADEPAEAVEETDEPVEAVEETDEPAEAVEETDEPTEAVEEIAEPVAEVEAETVPEETAKAVEWPVTLESKGYDYTVTATFDESAGFPADVKMNVSEIGRNSDAYQDYYDQALEAIQNETDKDVELTEARFFDITFYTEEGEVEPAGPVNVSIKYRKAIEAESSDDVHVLHFDDNDNAAPQIMDIETDGRGDKVNEVSFETDSFSIYAVVGTAEAVETESRMTLNFYNRNVSEPLATVYVKNGDTGEEIDKIIFDPGAGTLESGQLFKGWIEKENYTVEDVANKMTIADIRSWAKEKANNNEIKEGEEHNFYAMVFKTFSVSFKDEDDVTMHSEALITDGESVDYTILQTYTPKDQDEVFMGWFAEPEGYVTPKEESATYPYPYNTDVTITGSVVFRVDAPKGHWLNFEGNGHGSSYTPPQFIRNEGVTAEPSAPLRKGYVFDSWWTGAPAEEGQDPTGEKFTFGQTLSENTTLYAKWTTATSAKYSVIIWKQRSTDDKNAADDDKTYDVAEVISLTGTPGASASSVVAQTGSNVNTGSTPAQVRNYRVDGTEKGYTGFHAGRYDQNVTIAAEGTTVLNVYYDRNLITINFDAGSGYYIHNDNTGNYARRVTYTGLYDSELSFVWPTQTWRNSSGTGSGTSALWSDGSTTWSFFGAFKLPTETDVTISLSRTNAGSVPYRFIRQKPDGSWPNENETDYVLTVYMSSGSFRITNKYAGFTVYQYKTGAYTTSDTGWVNTAPGASVNTGSSGFNVRFTRDNYKINYFDGTYFNGNGAILQEATKEDLGESGEIYYGATIDSYNKGGTDYFEPASQDEYVFAGWYVDPTCSSPYTFTTMPAGGIQVYAKWVQKQYRVFLHPNVPSDDASFSMGNQSTSFRADYNDKIAGGNPIKTQRDSYDLIGWYEEDGSPFNFAAYTLNDTTVPTPYDTTDDGVYNPTDPTELDKYGNPTSEGNKDAENQRVWILRKLDLYARWRSTIDGAKGINLEYVADPGTNAPTDDLFYLDNAEATAGAASTPPDTTPTQQFMYWVVQTWNGSDYVDTGVKVYPGDVFTVLKADAKAVVTEWANPEDEENDYITVADPQPGTTPPDSTHTKIKKATYTVRLRAAYGDAEMPTPTHITWYANNGTGDTEIDTDLKINEAVEIKQPGTFSYQNYEFIGWARKVEVSDNDGNVETIDGVDPANLALDLGEDDLFLEWDADNGKFIATAETGSGYTAGDEVTQIAADEKSPYHGMVAVWKRAKFYIYHSSNGDVDDVEIPDGTVDLTTYVKTGYLYGGYYHYDEVDGQRTKGEAYTDNGKALVPTADTFYYLKEVDERHLRPKLYLISNDIHNGLIQRLYGIVSIDETYDVVGFIIKEKKYPATVVTGDITVYKEGEDEPVDILNGGTFGFDGCPIGLADFTELIEGGAKIDITGYYKTPDGVVVTGNKIRRIQFPAGSDSYGGMPLFTGWGSGTGQTRTGLVKSTSETTYEGGSNDGKMKVVRMLKLSAPSNKIEYKITKIYDSGTEEQIVEGGNYIGKVTYAPKSGYMFAGWYQDADYTVPADFADVTGDMTVYAKYISEKDITVAFSRKSAKSNTTTFNATISVKNRDQLENVTVNVNDDISAVLATKSVKKSGSGKNIKYTTQYKGTVAVKGLSTRDTFTASVSWTTPDGTLVTGTNRNCTYNYGIVTVK